jgi:hypothetical protein
MISGSNRSLKAVKPLRSANSTVTVRRSASPAGPSGAVRMAVGAVALDMAAGAEAGRPSVAAPPSTREPHFGQKAKSGAHG